MCTQLNRTAFESDLAALINRYSQENAADTPDFILAQYLCGCMDTFNNTVRRRDQWYGHVTLTAREARP